MGTGVVCEWGGTDPVSPHPRSEPPGRVGAPSSNETPGFTVETGSAYRQMCTSNDGDRRDSNTLVSLV